MVFSPDPEAVTAPRAGIEEAHHKAVDPPHRLPLQQRGLSCALGIAVLRPAESLRPWPSSYLPWVSVPAVIALVADRIGFRYPTGAVHSQMHAVWRRKLEARRHHWAAARHLVIFDQCSQLVHSLVDHYQQL